MAAKQCQQGGNKKRDKTQEDSMYPDAIFGSLYPLLRVVKQITFTPSFTGYMPLVNLIHRFYFRDSIFIDTCSVELFRYYASVLFWLRVIGLKNELQRNKLTDAEKTVWRTFRDSKYNIPEPIYLALNSIGKIRSKLGVDLYPDFPDLATEVVNCIPGSYGKVSVDNHCLYEELPVIGPTIQGMIERINGNHPTKGRKYTSVFAMDGTEATINLQGYASLDDCSRNEVETMKLLGVSALKMFSLIENTGINRECLNTVSHYLENTNSFRLYEVDLFEMSKLGTEAQYIEAIPDLTQLSPDIRADNTYVSMQCVTEETAVMVAVSKLFGLNQYKESIKLADETLEPWVAVLPWSAVAFNNSHRPPDGYIENRNARRNLPDVYHNNCFFRSISWSLEDSRRDFIENIIA